MPLPGTWLYRSRRRNKHRQRSHDVRRATTAVQGAARRRGTDARAHCALAAHSVFIAEDLTTSSATHFLGHFCTNGLAVGICFRLVRVNTGKICVRLALRRCLETAIPRTLPAPHRHCISRTAGSQHCECNHGYCHIAHGSFSSLYEPTSPGWVILSTGCTVSVLTASWYRAGSSCSPQARVHRSGACFTPSDRLSPRYSAVFRFPLALNAAAVPSPGRHRSCRAATG